MFRFFGSMLACAILVTAADASKVKLWQHHAPAHYDKAKLKDTVVSSEGVVRLARLLRPLGDFKADHVWDVVEDGKGNLYLATGDEGKIFKISPEGKSSLVYTAKDSQVFCLHLGPDGEKIVTCKTVTRKKVGIDPAVVYHPHWDYGPFWEDD